MKGNHRRVLVVGGSSSLHARIPAQMLREDGYRVILANAETTVADGTLDFFDDVRSIVHPLERVFLPLRTVVRSAEVTRPVGDTRITIPTRRKSLYWRMLRGRLRGGRLHQIIQELHPGLIHIQSTAVAGLPVYYCLRRVGYRDRARRPGLLVHLFSYHPRFPALRAREMQLLRLADRIHTSSPVVAQIYEEHYDVPPAKMQVLVRGIDLETFAPRDEATLQAARDEWGIPSDKFIIIHNRHLHPMYSVEVAIDAFIELIRRGADAFLILVRGSMCTEDYERAMLARLASAGLSERVALMPPVLSADQMATALQIADCSINTVPFDAFPVSILESMYCRAIPVVRDLEGYRLFVKEGETGFLCAGSGIDNYVRNIETLIRDPERKQAMADAGADLVRKEADAKIYRMRLLELVKDCIREW